MGDMGEFWRDVKPDMQKMSRDKRARNRRNGESELFVRGVPFTKKNGGAHLIVLPDDPKMRVDYWPGTGLWRTHWETREGRGIASLLKFLGRE